MAQRFKFYVVVDKNGKKIGTFDRWFGIGSADEAMEENPGARAKGFQTIDEANAWLAMKSNATAAKNYDELINRAIDGDRRALNQAAALLTGKSTSHRPKSFRQKINVGRARTKRLTLR